MRATAIYSSTCCHPSADIIAVDLVGNTGSCELSAVSQVVNIEAQTKYDELKLELGKTFRLEFYIRNLGTKGSFTLQASENKHYTGYVAPLNVNLGHKQGTRGEVVLTGQKETGSNKTSLVVKAVPLRNLSYVQLFEISVTVEKRFKPSLGWNVTADVTPHPLILQYGVEEVLKITLTNNGLAGTFDLKVSPQLSA